MDLNLTILLKNSLFKDIDEKFLMTYLEDSKCSLHHYSKNALIHQEGDPCTSIGFVLFGHLSLQQMDANGKAFTLQEFSPTDCFGAALYSKESPRYPFHLTALTDSQVFYLPFECVHKLLEKSQLFSMNFIHFLSSQIFNFNQKLEILHYKDVRSRLMLYLSKEYNRHQQTHFELSQSKILMADFMGIARGSVSRELKHMVDDGLISISGKKITLLRPELFKVL